LKTVRELDHAVSRASTLIDAWYAADLGAFEAAQHAMTEEVYSRLVVQRNELWVRWIVKGLNEAPDVLILVGSLHLAGPHSLIEMVAARGVDFKRVHGLEE